MKNVLSSKEVLEKKAEYLAPTVKHWYANPPHFVSGRMQHLFDAEGKQYLDMFAGICTVSVGHCNPFVTERVIEQAKTLQHTSTIFLSQGIVQLAERLAAIAPGRLQKSFLTNSGTEANEAAILMAKNFTGRTEIIALRHSYHGRSYLAGSLTAQSQFRVDLTPVPGISFAPNAYCYRCPMGKTKGSCELECAKAVEDVILTQTTGQPAVMIAEPIQGVGGIITPPPGYFGEVKRILEKYGVLFLADEVQTGFGRTGEHWFGISAWGVEPDLMTMAKGIANGLPAGAAIARADIADGLQRGTINTFGGNPISAEAAMATIEYIEAHGLMANAKTMGSYFMDQLRELEATYSVIGEVRGMGLMIGVEIVKDRTTKEPSPELTNRILELTKDSGVIIGKGGIYGNTLRIQPPMIITKSDVDQAIKAIKGALEVVCGAAVHA